MTSRVFCWWTAVLLIGAAALFQVSSAEITSSDIISFMGSPFPTADGNLICQVNQTLLLAKHQACSNGHKFAWTDAKGVTVPSVGTGRYIHQGNGKLRTQSASATAADFGNFTCSIVCGGETVESQKITLYQEIGFRNTDAVYHAVEGGAITMECRYEGSPKLTQTWTFPLNATDSDTRYLVAENTLEILNVSRHDAGDFTCDVLQSVEGFSAGLKSRVIKLVVEYPPVFLDPSESKIPAPVGAGEVSLICCSMDSAVTGNWTWTFSNGTTDATVINDTTPNVRIDQTHPCALHVTPVSDYYFGTYTCSFDSVKFPVIHRIIRLVNSNDMPHVALSADLTGEQHTTTLSSVTMEGVGSSASGTSLSVSVFSTILLTKLFLVV